MPDRLTVRALRALLADLPDGLPVVIFNPACATFEFAASIKTGRVFIPPSEPRSMLAVDPGDPRGLAVVWVRA